MVHRFPVETFLTIASVGLLNSFSWPTDPLNLALHGSNEIVCVSYWGFISKVHFKFCLILLYIIELSEWEHAFIIRYWCCKQCELLLNRFLIKDLRHKLNLLCHLPLSSIIDDKIRPLPLSQPRVQKNVRPPPLLSTPQPTKYLDPTSILTIRSLYIIYIIY